MKHPNTHPFANEGKPVIRYNHDTEIFTRNGVFITDAKAREHWDQLDSDWSFGAHTEMTKRILHS